MVPSWLIQGMARSVWHQTVPSHSVLYPLGRVDFDLVEATPVDLKLVCF